MIGEPIEMVSAELLLDVETDQIIVRIPAADGEGDVTLLTLDVAPLSETDKHRLRHVRPPGREQPPPGPHTVHGGRGR